MHFIKTVTSGKERAVQGRGGKHKYLDLICIDEWVKFLKFVPI